IVKRTWFGKAMRALSANEEAARLMGVKTSRVIALTFALGSSLAALGAVLYCLDQSQVYPTMGFIIGTRAFVAAVLGGIGSITGAMLGGLLLGVVGEMVKLTDYSGGVDVLVFLVLIAVLLVRPAGLLGSTRAEKVQPSSFPSSRSRSEGSRSQMRSGREYGARGATARDAGRLFAREC